MTLPCHMEFSQKLIFWYLQNKRDLPWRKTTDPYKIWLSEIILQQTRVNQGLSYYNAFLSAFPTVSDLANAPEDQVMRLWQGLGYYSRARNLHNTAKIIENDHKGRFPGSYDGLMKLKGIGPYTASAISSFCYNEPRAVVDGNVYRVLSRYFGIREHIDTTSGKKTFASLAQEILPKDQPGTFNQAIMEFGALACKPKSPNCQDCQVASTCAALKNGWVDTLPFKSKKTAVKERFFNYLVIRSGENTFIRKREEKDIWQNLYEFPLIETQDLVKEEEVIYSDNWKKLFGSKKAVVKSISPILRHQLSHRTIHARFFEIYVPKTIAPADLLKVPIGSLNDYAFPRLITLHLEKQNS